MLIKTDIQAFSLVGLFMALLSLPVVGWAQPNSPTEPANMIHFGVEEGLPSNTVYYVHQDKQGFIWFCTDKGVVRFDGMEMEVFTEEDGLSDKETFSITEDSKGRLWFATYNGLPTYFHEGRFYSPFNTSWLNKIKLNGYIKILYEDVNQNMWVGGKLFGLYRIEGDSSVHSGFNHMPLLTLYEDHKENLIFLCRGFFYYKVFQPKKNGYDSIQKIELSVVDSDQLNEISFGIGKYIFDAQHDLLLRIGANTNWLHISNDSILQYLSLEDQPIWYNVLMASDNKIYITHEGGISTLSYNRTNEQSYLLSSYVQLPGLQVSYFIIDDEGDSWVTSLNDGVYYMPQQFTTRYTNDVDRTMYLFEHDEDLWAVWEGKGIGRYINNESKLEIDFPSIYQWSRIDENYWSLFGVFNNHTIYDHGNDAFIPSFTGGGAIIKRDTCYWNGSSNGFEIYSVLINQSDTGDEGRSSALELDGGYDRRQRLPYPVTALEEYGEDCLIASQKGLALYNSRLDTAYLFPQLQGQHIIDLSSYPLGDLQWYWLYSEGTITGFSTELDTISYQSEVFKTYSFNKIAQINDTLLGLSSDHGLLLFDIDHKAAELYPLARISNMNGLPNNQVNDFLLFHDTLFIATDVGVAFTPISTINHYELGGSPIPMIKQFLVDGQPKSTFDHIRIPDGNQGVEVVHAGIQYRSLGQIQFRYRFNENDNWVETFQPREYFPNLSSGTYHYEVQAKGLEGGWSEESATIDFTILAPIYQRWWFLILANLIVIGLIILAVYRRNQKQKKEAQLAIKLSTYELKALRAQINPHFIFNVLASIQRFILTNDKLAANEYLTKFSRLTRMTLNHSDKLLVPLEDELKSIEYYMELERLRLDMGFDYKIEVGEAIDPTRLQIPPLMLQTFLENAIWHGVAQLETQGQVTVSVQGVADKYHISIRDNGIGREASAKVRSKSHKSRGTSIVFEKLALLNKMHYGSQASVEYIDHDNQDGSSAGTEVLIILPHMQ